MSNNPATPHPSPPAPPIRKGLSGWAVVEKISQQKRLYVGQISEYRLGHAAFIRIECPEQPGESMKAVDAFSFQGGSYPAGTHFVLKGKKGYSTLINTTEVSEIQLLTEEQAMEAMDRIRPRKIVAVEPPSEAPLPPPTEGVQ